MATNIETKNSIKMLTEKDLINAFIEKHEIRVFGTTRTPESLGSFPLNSELLEAMRKEYFYITEDQDGVVKVSDSTGITTRQFNSRTDPQLVAWPNVSVDFKEKEVVCGLIFRVGKEETFPMTVSQRLCRAVVSGYPDCHPFIQETAATGSAGEPWADVGCGPIMSLAEAFNLYGRKEDREKRNTVRWALVRAKLGIFHPDPMEPLFVMNGDHWRVHNDWRDQIAAFKNTF